MLDRYEKGMTQEKYDAFFNNVKEKLVPLIHEIQNKPQINDDLLHETYDLDRQEKFMKVICDFMKVDFGKVYLSTTEHPFTDFFSSNDARITTHYYPDQFLSAILQLYTNMDMLFMDYKWILHLKEPCLHKLLVRLHTNRNLVS